MSHFDFFLLYQIRNEPNQSGFWVLGLIFVVFWGKIKKLHNRASAPCIKPIFIFPQILAGKQGAALSTSTPRCNPIASVKDHNLSQLCQVGDSSLVTRYFKNFPKLRLLWRQRPHTKQSPRVSLCVLKRDLETTARSYGDSDLAQPHHPFAAPIKSTSCGKICSAGGTPSGFTK